MRQCLAMIDKAGCNVLSSLDFGPMGCKPSPNSLCRCMGAVGPFRLVAFLKR